MENKSGECYGQKCLSRGNTHTNQNMAICFPKDPTLENSLLIRSPALSDTARHHRSSHHQLFLTTNFKRPIFFSHRICHQRQEPQANCFDDWVCHGIAKCRRMLLPGHHGHATVVHVRWNALQCCLLVDVNGTEDEIVVAPGSTFRGVRSMSSCTSLSSLSSMWHSQQLTDCAI